MDSVREWSFVVLCEDSGQEDEVFESGIEEVCGGGLGSSAPAINRFLQKSE